MDSAFAAKTNKYIVTSGGKNIGALSPAKKRINAAATSVRQYAEWGMRALQGSFPRLKDRIKYEVHGERKEILQCIVLLYNFRARTVGLNQITNTFMPHLSKDAMYLFQEEE